MPNTVFILGAGASSEAGAPLMPQFINAARDLPRADRGAIQSVLDATAALARSQAKATINLQNVEEIFSAFELAALVGRLGDLKTDDIAALPGAVGEMIARTLEARIEYPFVHETPKAGLNVGISEPRFQPDKTHGQFADLVATLAKLGHAVSILTFNYDMCVEMALDNKKVPYVYCLTVGEPVAELQLLKLHGSLNWSRCSECEKTAAWPLAQILESMYSRWRREGWPSTSTKTAPRLRFFDELVKRNHCHGGKTQELLIVPPSWNKLGKYADIRTVWAAAIDVLKQAENIVVIGYSWPPSDHFFSYLYALGTAGDTLLRRFLVVDPEAETIERFKGMLGQQALAVFKPLQEKFGASFNDVLAEFTKQ